MKNFSIIGVLIPVFLDIASAAEPRVFGLDFTKQVGRDAPGAGQLRRRAKTLAVNIDNDEIAYTINMTIGTPPQSFNLQLDTGSSDIWVPAVNSDICSQGQGACPAGSFDKNASSTFQDQVTDTPFSITYEDSSASSGIYFNDTVTIGQTSLKNMRMGLATQASTPLGIMGIGYNADESIVTSSDSSQVYPNVISQMKDQGVINTLAYSLWLNDLNSNTGSILFGGIDTAKYHGSVTVLPVQQNTNGYVDFTVTLSSLSLSDPSGKAQYQQQSLSLPVILDSGTTAAYVPDNIANDILAGVGAISNPDYGMIVPCSLANSPDVFTFGFGGNGGATITVSIGEFVSPIFNDDGTTPTFKDGSGAVCTWDLLSSGPAGQPLLLGDAFLRSAYVVYDLENNQIGIAQTNFNTTDSNVVEISGTAIPSAATTATLAAATQSYTGHPLEQGHTKTGHTGGGSAKSATFNLGLTSATGKSKSGGALVSAPRVDATMVATSFVVIMSMVFGGSLIVMM